MLLAHHAGPRIVIRTRARIHTYTYVILSIPPRRNNGAMCSLLTSEIRFAAFDMISHLSSRFVAVSLFYKYATRLEGDIPISPKYRIDCSPERVCPGSISADSRNDCTRREAAGRKTIEDGGEDGSADRVRVHCCRFNAPFPANNSPSFCRRAQ